jgi:hypothetical protein
VLVEYRESDNLLASTFARFMVEIARGESLVRQRSMIRSLEDEREILVLRRRSIELTAADLIAQALNLGRDHRVDPLRELTDTDRRLVCLALAPLDQKEASS